MKRIVSDARVIEYVNAKVGTILRPPLTALGLDIDGEIVAGVVFNDFNGFNVEVTVAGDRKAFTRAFIRRVGQYVFEELDCLRMSITTGSQDVAALAIRLGAQTAEGRKKNLYGAGRDGIILGILRENWKV